MAAVAGAAAVVAGVTFWSGQLEAAQVRRDLRLAEQVAVDFERGHPCWTATGTHGVPAMMTANGWTAPLADPGAWSATFGTRLVSRLGVAPGLTDPAYMTMQRTRPWTAIHFTSADATHRAVLEALGGDYTGAATVTVEMPRRDGLKAGRRLIVGVREGPAGC